MSEEPLEAEAVEEPSPEGEVETDPTRRLPARPESAELAPRRELRTAALAAAGGLVAGVVTVAAVNAARAIGSGARSRRPRRSSKRERAVDVVASRSFLIDVHVLGR